MGELLSKQESLQVWLDNGNYNYRPRCGFCGDSLPAKYLKSGERTPKSGGFWNHHVTNCTARAESQAKHAAYREQQGINGRTYEFKYNVDGLVATSLTEDQSIAIVKLMKNSTQ